MVLAELAGRIGARVQGDSQRAVKGVGDLELLRVRDTQRRPDRDLIYYVESKKVLNENPVARECEVVLTTEALAANFQIALVVPDLEPRLAFIRLLEFFEAVPPAVHAPEPLLFVHPTAKVHESAVLGPGVVILGDAVVGAGCIIHANSVIEQNVQIGAGTVIHPHVVLKFGTRIGEQCIVHSGTVIGADGFGFYDKNNKRYKIPQIGNVEIGSHVEIGASVTIDRATIESTRVGNYTKLDDQVHIGHNCQVGEYVYIAGNTVLAGSVIVDDHVTMGGQSAISGRVRLAKGTFVMGLTGMAQSSEPGGMYFGIPARPAREMHKINNALGYLPTLLKRVAHLEEIAGVARAEEQRSPD
ncbi:UDP-3-O-(3-hydroxymyristoyl)glucosamine N-acyltransferase [Turneriella parva]|uniref:UDP-3-O-(3-hydroxymyristoyl) glucosamine N-acyltransferase n=1 Tax=Turneriella parva (strain ATCC BAA-1111 / DSM 21527 / NCTC 11395 / H) TaxID=869212 RepID=I4B8A1_TURPD|nr:UDP-3-O-(3-hydroxymyristoyl)glucosamine N-acyltransferase [Turneriella parva]AFM13508.1 UDP-3-O-(3-hydroxymyristoyl) glucosamine N-acyltransferase [Turneriella parva DSM 21527]